MWLPKPCNRGVEFGHFIQNASNINRQCAESMTNAVSGDITSGFYGCSKFIFCMTIVDLGWTLGTLGGKGCSSATRRYKKEGSSAPPMTEMLLTLEQSRQPTAFSLSRNKSRQIGRRAPRQRPTASPCPRVSHVTGLMGFPCLRVTFPPDRRDLVLRGLGPGSCQLPVVWVCSSLIKRDGPCRSWNSS